jgi:sporulation protein YlmC with PRC-barrel domain
MRKLVLAAWVVGSAAAAPAFAQAPIPATSAPLTAPVAVTAAVAPQPTVSASPMDALDGFRTSKVIGAAVYGDDGVSIGSVDDMIVRLDQKVSVVVLSVGGFLGVGTKLVTVPFSDIHIVGGKVSLPGVSKEKLAALPTFTYPQ